MPQSIRYFPPDKQPHKKDCECYSCEVYRRAKADSALTKDEYLRLIELRRKMRGGQIVRISGKAYERAFNPLTS